MTMLEILIAVATRIVAAREEFDRAVAEQILADLEHDLAGWLAAYEEERRAA
jgi:hypothetical protein